MVGVQGQAGLRAALEGDLGGRAGALASGYAEVHQAELVLDTGVHPVVPEVAQGQPRHELLEGLGAEQGAVSDAFGTGIVLFEVEALVVHLDGPGDRRIQDVRIPVLNGQSIWP